MKLFENKGCGAIALFHAAFVVSALVSLAIGITDNSFDVTFWFHAMAAIYGFFAMIAGIIIFLTTKVEEDGNQTKES